MISKELLSEVLGINEEQCGVYEIDFIQDYKLYFKYDMFGIKAVNNINIYELAHRCKEWAFNKGIYISSGYADMEYDGDTCIASYRCYSAINLRCGYHSYNSKFDICDWLLEREFDGYTEPEAVFKACQWVLDNKDK